MESATPRLSSRMSLLPVSSEPIAAHVSQAPISEVRTDALCGGTWSVLHPYTDHIARGDRREDVLKHHGSSRSLAI